MSSDFYFSFLSSLRLFQFGYNSTVRNCWFKIQSTVMALSALALPQEKPFAYVLVTELSCFWLGHFYSDYFTLCSWHYMYIEEANGPFYSKSYVIHKLKVQNSSGTATGDWLQHNGVCVCVYMRTICGPNIFINQIQKSHLLCIFKTLVEIIFSSMQWNFRFLYMKSRRDCCGHPSCFPVSCKLWISHQWYLPGCVYCMCPALQRLDDDLTLYSREEGPYWISPCCRVRQWCWSWPWAKP